MNKQAILTPKKSAPTKKNEPFFAGKQAAASQKKQVNKSKSSNNNFRILKEDIAQIAKNKKFLTPPNKIVSNVKKAVAIDPSLQVDSLQKDAQVNAMDNAPIKKFDAKKYANTLIEKIKKVIPKDKDEFDKDPTSNNKLQDANDEIQSSLVEAEHESSEQLVDASNTLAFDNNQLQQPATLTLETIGTNEKPHKINVRPTLHTSTQNDLSKESEKIDNYLVEHNITKSTLENSNEARFTNTVIQINDSQTNATQTHAQYVNIAQPLANATGLQNAQLITQKINASHQHRIDKVNAINSKQTEGKTNEEKIRTKVANDLSAIVNKTKSDVKLKLDDLAQTVKIKFQLALNVANIIFESNVRRRTDIGIFEWIANKIQGLPNNLKVIFTEEQNLFIERLRPTIESIGSLIDNTLQVTKQIVIDGRTAVDNYWKLQDDTTKNIAQDLFDHTNDQFNELESDIDNTNQTLQDEITTQFNQAVSNLEATFERIKEENKSWLESAYDAVVSVVDSIIEMKNLLVDILSKAANAVDKILDDPIAFLKNILKAIKDGFLKFKDNIFTHLKEGFIKWLVGNIPGEVEIPKTWDAKGIFTLVASILGITWKNIKARAIKMYGPTIVHSLETAFEVFILIKNEGLSGLWNFIKEKLVDFKNAAFASIQEFLIEKVIKAGVTWVISLFNPASAFIKACMLIYDVISWFIKNAKRLINLVNGIIDSIVDITAGNLKAASGRVERSLADTIPIVIGFLAGLLGLGDLSERIRSIMEKLRVPINNAIDWLLKKAGDLVKGLLKAGKAGVEKIAGWLGLRETYRSKDGHEHSLFFEEIDGKPVLMRASVKQSFIIYMNSIRASVHKYNDTITDPKKKVDMTAIESKYRFLLQNMANYNEFKKNEISKNLNDLGKLLALLPEDIAQDVNIYFPNHTSKFSPKTQTLPNGKSNDGGTVSITSLSLKLGKLNGSPGKHTSELFKHIHDKIPSGNKGNLIRGHLLNHYLGGTGDHARNIAPIAKKTNNEMERLSENSSNERMAKKSLLSGSVFDYEVKINYANSEKFNANIPSEIIMTTTLKNFDENLPRTQENMKTEKNWKKVNEPKAFPLSNVQTDLENLLN